jgi:superfamily I DNA/RNA helicase
MHSLGFAAIRRVFRSVRVENYKLNNLLEDMIGDLREVTRAHPTLVSGALKLTNLVKQTLSDTDEYSLESLATLYDVDLNGDKERVFSLVPELIKQSAELTTEIDFADMIWLPVYLNLPVYRNDLLVVDEAQDLNHCQQELALKAGDRLVLVGDDKQAIYGFAGADTTSLDSMRSRLEATERGCEVLPLTFTRRCGKRIVEAAQKIVEDFDAFPDAHEGEVDSVPLETYTSQVGDGDFVLCRVNAPLVSQCFRFLKDDRKATIAGRDIGQGLLNLLDRVMKGYDPLKGEPDIVFLNTGLEKWYHDEIRKETDKRNPSDAKLIALQDKYDCLQAFIENERSVKDVKSRIEKIFSDSEEGIRLSSIHKAKGLEAERVFILAIDGASIPHPMARSEWQLEQEFNLKYVAITRAVKRLTWVTD